MPTWKDGKACYFTNKSGKCNAQPDFTKNQISTKLKNMQA